MKIPLSPIRSNIGNYHSYLYGFGYDHSRDDYLLVSLSYVPTLAVHISSSHLEIFSLRDNAWKEIEDTRRLPYLSPYCYPKEGFLFNGAIHWFVSRRGSLGMVIIAFDLTERKLLEIPFPYGFRHYSKDICLWVFGEFLGLCAMRDGIVEIWVMKEYKVQSSWTKTFVFPIDGIPYFSPIYSTKNGDIIGTIRGTGLVKYNSKGQLLENRSYCDDPRGSQVVMYTESLLSLPDYSKEV
jgi:F-box interacting protein